MRHARSLFVTVAILLSSVGLRAAAAVPEELAKLRSDYNTSMEAAYGAGDAEEKRLGNAYVGKLQTLEASSQKKGELEYVLLIKRERERFVQEKSIDPNKLATLPLALHNAQKTYLSAREKIDGKRHAAAIKASRSYIEKLKVAQAMLTKARRIADALKVREEIKNVEDTIAATTMQTGKDHGTGERPASRSSSKSPTLPVIADAYVRGGDYETGNFGNESMLAAKTAKGGNFLRRSFLKFDLSSVTYLVSEAKLRIFCVENDNQGSDAQELHTLASEAWDEMSISAVSGRPDRGERIAKWKAPAVGASVDVDVTKAVKAAIENRQKTISFCIYPGGRNRYVAYASKEHPEKDKHPVLLINGGAR